MQSVLCIVLLGIAALHSTCEAKEICYDNWDKWVEWTEGYCKDCKQKNTEEDAIKKCFQKTQFPLDAEGNLKKDEYVDFMIDNEDFKGDETLKKSIKDEIRECSKNGATTPAEFDKVNSCSNDVMIKYCRDAKQWIDVYKKSEVMKGCRYF